MTHSSTESTLQCMWVLTKWHCYLALRWISNNKNILSQQQNIQRLNQIVSSFKSTHIFSLLGPSNNPQIVLLDHGLYQELPTEIRQPLARVWQAVVENNHTNMKKYSEMLGIQGMP